MDILEQGTVKRHRFTVEEYHKMGEAGIFGEDDRVELLDGEVLEMSPIGWRHVWCVNALNVILVRFAQGRYTTSVQNPISLRQDGELQPDLVLLRDAPIGRLPGPREILLLVEVADTSLAYDREVKLARYVQAGIPEVWLADLNADRLEIHCEPGPGGYRKTLSFTHGQRVESATLLGLVFDADEVLPPREPELGQ